MKYTIEYEKDYTIFDSKIVAREEFDSLLLALDCAKRTRVLLEDENALIKWDNNTKKLSEYLKD